MRKLKEVNGYVRFTLDKLNGIRTDLVKVDDSWQNWSFPEFIEALRKWMERNPEPNDVTKENHVNCKDKLLQKNKIHTFIAKQGTTRQVVVKRFNMLVTERKCYQGKNLYW